MLPDLGEGFVIDCLQYYDLDPEQVVNAILEENLPPCLSKLDRYMSKPQESEKLSPHTSKENHLRNQINHAHESQSIPKAIHIRP